MARVHVGDQSFLILVVWRADVCIAHAVRAETGDRFGADFSGSSEAEAVAALTRWLEWQDSHARALLALQEAERVYHRTLADQAFGARQDDEGRRRALRESLNLVEEARAALDAIRASGRP